MIDEIAYKLFGKITENQVDQYPELEDWIEGGEMGTTPEKYLSKVYLAGLAGGIAGAFLIGLLTGILFFLGGMSGTAALVTTFLIAMPAGGVVTFVTALYYPKLEYSKRKSEINRMMPYGATFMYALSRGGSNYVSILREIANSEDTYGELAREYQKLIREIEYSESDIFTALRNVSERSPSEQFKELNQDLMSIIESGGSMTNFFKDKSEEALEQTRRKEEQFVETIEVLAQLYTIVFVAAPIFVVVILMVMIMLGQGNILQLYAVLYGLIPILAMAFMILLSTMTEDTRESEATIDTDREPFSYEHAKERYGHLEDEEIQNLIEQKDQSELEKLIKNPKKTMYEKPIYTPAVTVPLTIVYMILISLLVFDWGAMMENTDLLFQSATEITAAYVTIPLLMIIGPIAWIDSRKRKREQKLIKRLPDLFSKLSSANRVGMSLPEAIDSIEEESSGELSKQLIMIKKDMEWNNQTSEALEDFANRIKIPDVSRSVKLITKASRSTGDIGNVLEIAANDLKSQELIRKNRARALSMHKGVTIASFVIFIGIILALDTFFLETIETIAEDMDTGGAQGGGGMGINIAGMPIDRMRMAFFHATIIQALTTGTLIGYLQHNTIRGGLKLSLTLMTLTTVIFLIL